MERVIAGHEPRFPDRSHVFPSDLVTDEKIRESHEKGQTVVIVDERERVRVLPPPEGSVREREPDWLDELLDW
jgi:hypothetical protein